MMKHTFKTALAVAIALLLAFTTLTLAEDANAVSAAVDAIADDAGAFMPDGVAANDLPDAADGFSTYTVEFTRNALQYVLTGGESVALSEVLAALGLAGEVSGAETSAPGLFSVSRDETGAWMVHSRQPFSSEEWMKVTLNGTVIQIDVTDTQEGAHSHNDIVFNPTSSLPNSAGNYYLTNDVNLTRTWQVNAGTVNLCLNGHSITESNNAPTITILNGSTLNLFDCPRTEDGITIYGTITHAERDASTHSKYPGPGVKITSGTFNMYGGKIRGNEYTGGGAGVHLVQGTFIMEGRHDL